jgi:hypothetical protein
VRCDFSEDAGSNTVMICGNHRFARREAAFLVTSQRLLENVNQARPHPVARTLN